jgi:hypothetical protein
MALASSCAAAPSVPRSDISTSGTAANRGSTRTGPVTIAGSLLGWNSCSNKTAIRTTVGANKKRKATMASHWRCLESRNNAAAGFGAPRSYPGKRPILPPDGLNEPSRELPDSLPSALHSTPSAPMAMRCSLVRASSVLRCHSGRSDDLIPITFAPDHERRPSPDATRLFRSGMQLST